ncbi:Hypothetical predicted protein [Olea europaea subsp. europaea]|uniref:Uncharacterized protein n=1 Tax=Olea europaea subsp. europaea TaxID=158383 RepID=A0A8S0QJJ5_OLEEU|nr:Hypothetical predicted protein [Olea europaea subsp. europaea]
MEGSITIDQSQGIAGEMSNIHDPFPYGSLHVSVHDFSGEPLRAGVLDRQGGANPVGLPSHSTAPRNPAWRQLRSPRHAANVGKLADHGGGRQGGVEGDGEGSESQKLRVLPNGSNMD